MTSSGPGNTSAFVVEPTAAATTTALAPPGASIETLPGDINMRQRVLELISGGSPGEKIVRGFLIGVALGLVIGGVCCCWVPCFGRRQQEIRRMRREDRVRRGYPARVTLGERMPWLRRLRLRRRRQQQHQQGQQQQQQQQGQRPEEEQREGTTGGDSHAGGGADGSPEPTPAEP